MAGLGDLLHRLEQIAADMGRGSFLAAFIEPPAILQLELVVETEEVGRAGRAIGPRDILALVIEIGKGEMMGGGEALHVVEGIVGVMRRIVGRDGTQD